MKQKKLMALLLVLCMVLSLLPTVALADTVTDTLDLALTGMSGTTYAEWSGKEGDSGAVYAGQSAGGNSSIQLRSNNSNSGIVTTASGGKATKIVVTWNGNTANGRTLNVYGKSTAYSAATELYSSSNQGTLLGTIVKGTSTELNISGDYEYIGMRSASGAMYLTSIEITWSTDGDTPQPETYTVSFDAGEGSGTMADQTTTGSLTLPTCTFTAPEGYEFAGWKMDGDDTVYAAGATVTISADTTFTAQWTLIPVVTYTDMMLKRVPANGDVVVIYYPAAGKVMTGTDYFYNNKKHELVAADATLTDNVLAVPDEAVRLTVSVADGKYTFATSDGKYLLADGTHVQLVDEQGANTLFQLETAAAGTDNWYIKCDSATYSGKAQYIEYYNGYFSVYGLSTNTEIYTFQFFSEDGEGPTPEVTYTVSFDANGGTGTMEDVTDATSPYTLPECTFTAPEGMVFAGWQMVGSETVYAAGEQVTLEEPNTTFVATWKELITKNYTLVTSADDLTAGDTVIVVGVNEGKTYALAQQWSNNRRAAEITVEGNQALVDVDIIATEKVDDYLVRELTIGGNAEDGWTFLDPLEGGYLYAASSTANHMKTQETNDDNGVFALTFGEGGAIVAVAQGANTYKYFRFNTAGIFSCYSETSSVQNPIYLYKYVEEEPAAPASFNGHKMVLGSDISVGFKVTVPADTDTTGWYMEFTYSDNRADTTVQIADATADGADYWFFAPINALELADTITATLYCGDATVVNEYSAMTYFNAAREALADNAKLMAIIDALQNYGHYLQLTTWSDNLTHTTIAAVGDAPDVAAAKTGVADMAAVKEIENTGVASVVVGLTLNSQTKLNIVVTLEDDVTMTSPESSYTMDGDRYVFETKGISPRNLAKVYTVKIKTSAGTAKVKASAMSYVNAMLNWDGVTEAQENAMAAYYNYYLAAAAY